MKEIKLTQGKVALVDDEDYEYLNQWKWFAQKGSNTYYARRSMNVDGKRIIRPMHQIIMNGKGIDHIDGNGLNNQRSNLRFATHQQNMINKKSLKNSASKYKGVFLRKKSNTWNSQIKHNGIRYFLGDFKDEVEAAKTYDIHAKIIFGEFAYLNFKPTEL